MTRVLISSTTTDLSDYRAAAQAVCAEEGMIPVAMERFPALGLSASAGSLERFSGGDVYVGIVAFRYGTIEPGRDRSITEMEFDYAGELGIERLCFLMHPDHVVPPAARERSCERRERLAAFRARLEGSLIRQLFTTVEDFKA